MVKGRAVRFWAECITAKQLGEELGQSRFQDAVFEKLGRRLIERGTICNDCIFHLEAIFATRDVEQCLGMFWLSFVITGRLLLLLVSRSQECCYTWFRLRGGEILLKTLMLRLMEDVG